MVRPEGAAALVQALADLQLVGELHDQDAVPGDQSDQGDQAHLGIDVDAGKSERQKGHGPEDRHGH